MITAYTAQTPIPARPEEWVRRRFRLPPSTAQLVCELAFSNRIATLADRGIACVGSMPSEAHQ